MANAAYWDNWNREQERARRSYARRWRKGPAVGDPVWTWPHKWDPDKPETWPKVARRVMRGPLGHWLVQITTSRQHLRRVWIRLDYDPNGENPNWTEERS